MADTKISALLASATLTGTEIVPVVQAGTTVRTTTQAIVNLGKAMSTASLLIGRGSGAGGGLQQEIQLDGTLTMSGTVLSVTPGTYGNAQTANPLSQFAATTSAQLAGVISDETGTGSLVFAQNPALGPFTATSINKVTITAPATSAVLTISDGKTLASINSISLAGTDGTTMTFPTASASVGYINIPQNSQSTAYTLVLADQGKHILHPTTDANARTFTIPANASVAYPLGTALTFINRTSQVLSIAITTDTLTLANSVTTGTRSLAQNGMATALKVEPTVWIISGTGLT